MSDFTKISTPRGEGRSMTPLSATSVTVNFDQTAENWFGPLAPMHPVAPPEVAGRAWDFTPGYNLPTQPRQFEPVSFATLRSLADAYDPLRIVIERRKDQLCRLPWTIRLKHEGNSKRPTRQQLSAGMRDRIDEVAHLFEQPSRGMSFRPWLRALTEDLLVIDAPSIYFKRDHFGRVTTIPFFDGATLRPLIDPWGRQPEPRAWSGEDFEFNGRTITRENFAQEGFKYLHGFAWPPIAQQVLKGLPAVNLSELDVLTRPMNIRPGHGPYGYSPVEQVMTTANIAIRRAHHQLEYYREGNMPEGFYSLPESWTPDQIQKFQDYFDNLHVGQLGQRRRIRFMSGKGNYQEIREPPLKADFDEWLIRIICAAFSYPPTAFVNLSNRSVSEQHEKTAEEQRLEPLKQHMAGIFNEIIKDHLGFDDLEFAWSVASDVDQEKESKILALYAKAGVLTLNQVRERLGEEPDPNKAANTLMVLTPNGYVTIGGANDSKPEEIEEH